MLKKLLMITFCMIAVASLTACVSNETEFDTSKNVTKYTRRSDSGTRDGFFTAIGFSDAKTNDELIPGSIKADDNGNMINLVKNDEYGIGYISLASAADSGLKVLTYEGVEPSEEAVVDGTYKLSRNFNYVTKVGSELSSVEVTLVKGFVLYMNSKEGLGIIKSKDGILFKSIASAKSFEDLLKEPENSDVLTLCQTPCADDAKVEIKFGGSTSVEKIAKALSQSFASLCPTFKPVHNHTGSGAAYKGTQGSEKNGVSSMHIGFLSREFSSSEACAEGTNGTLCKDGIVVVVNSANTAIANVTAEMLKSIYSTEKITWSEVLGK